MTVDPFKTGIPVETCTSCKKRYTAMSVFKCLRCDFRECISCWVKRTGGELNLQLMVWECPSCGLIVEYNPTTGKENVRNVE